MMQRITMEARVALPLWLVLVLATPFAGCSRQLEYRYQYDAFEMVETASAYSGGTVVANAKRMGMRSIGGPTVTEIEVEETHFAEGRQEPVYKGRLVFRCVTNDPFCERTGDTRQFGKRSRDVFRQWPYAHPAGF